jgi:hypothetical protein
MICLCLPLLAVNGALTIGAPRLPCGAPSAACSLPPILALRLDVAAAQRGTEAQQGHHQRHGHTVKGIRHYTGGTHEVLMSIVILLLTMASAPPPSNTEISEAVERVKAIVNQPVTAIPLDPGARVGLYRPGWFHPGAIKPDFAHVDVRRTQKFPYDRFELVTSDITPGLMFRSRDLEFNSMTKYFYTDRSRPKKRLTEGEMLEINRLYRIIAHGQQQASVPASPSATTAPLSALLTSSTARLGSLAAVLLLLAAFWLYRRRAAGAL